MQILYLTSCNFMFSYHISRNIGKHQLYLADCSEDAVGGILNWRVSLLHMWKETHACSSINGLIMAYGISQFGDLYAIYSQIKITVNIFAQLYSTTVQVNIHTLLYISSCSMLCCLLLVLGLHVGYRVNVHFTDTITQTLIYSHGSTANWTLNHTNTKRYRVFLNCQNYFLIPLSSQISKQFLSRPPDSHFAEIGITPDILREGEFIITSNQIVMLQTTDYISYE